MSYWFEKSLYEAREDNDDVFFNTLVMEIAEKFNITEDEALKLYLQCEPWLIKNQEQFETLLDRYNCGYEQDGIMYDEYGELLGDFCYYLSIDEGLPKEAVKLYDIVYDFCLDYGTDKNEDVFNWDCLKVR